VREAGGMRGEGREEKGGGGGLSDNVAEEAFCLKSAHEDICHTAGAMRTCGTSLGIAGIVPRILPNYKLTRPQHAIGICLMHLHGR